MKMLIAPLVALFLIGPAAAAGTSADGQPPVRFQHPEMRQYPLRKAGSDLIRTAKEMRAGSAWGTYGGMNGGDYQGMGGPDESEEEPRVYPRCRSRSDDRCRQGR